MAQQASIVITSMLRLPALQIECNFGVGFMIAFMHGCLQLSAAQELSKLN
jgi:hypothetical protein